MEKFESEIGQEPIPEDEKLPVGTYKLSVEFKTRAGKTQLLDLDPVDLAEGCGFGDLKKRALSEASTFGLHNFGMDVYVGKYPNGHPVQFHLEHKDGREINFTQLFDANGYPKQ